MNWLRVSKVVIAEVTVPSIGVGYELGITESLKLPILALHRLEPHKVSAMISGNPKMEVQRYERVEEARRHIDDFMIRLGYSPLP